MQAHIVTLFVVHVPLPYLRFRHLHVMHGTS